MWLRTGLVAFLFAASQLTRPSDQRPATATLVAVSFALGLFVVQVLPRMWQMGHGCPGRPDVRSAHDQALVIHIPSGADGLALPPEALEARLANAIASAGVGEFDGDLVGGDGAMLYMYGPDADRLFAVAEPVLRSSPLPAGAVAVKRYGPPGSPEERVALVPYTGPDVPGAAQ